MMSGFSTVIDSFILPATTYCLIDSFGNRRDPGRCIFCYTPGNFQVLKYAGVCSKTTKKDKHFFFSFLVVSCGVWASATRLMNIHKTEKITFTLCVIKFFTSCLIFFNIIIRILSRFGTQKSPVSHPKDTYGKYNTISQIEDILNSKHPFYAGK